MKSSVEEIVISAPATPHRGDVWGGIGVCGGEGGVKAPYPRRVLLSNSVTRLAGAMSNKINTD